MIQKNHFSKSYMIYLNVEITKFMFHVLAMAASNSSSLPM